MTSVSDKGTAFGCGHLGPVGWCGDCAANDRVRKPLGIKRWREDVSNELGRALDEVIDELDRAMDEYDPMASAHEGYSIILEELDELWELVREKQRDHRHRDMRKEARQVAAMAVRFMLEVTPHPADVAAAQDRADEYTETDDDRD